MEIQNTVNELNVGTPLSTGLPFNRTKMSQHKRIAAVALSVLLVLSVVGPAIAAAQEDGELEVEVEQDDGVLVTVSDDNGTVENATLNVSVDDENATYDGAGEYETDENGTVELPAPNETVNVTMVAGHDNRTGSASVTLEDSNESDEAEQPFGLQVQEFVHSLLNGEGDENLTIGYQVANFVLENNPGNAPDHAGPPAHAGNATNGSDAGPPENVTNGSDAGPPEDAGNGGDQGPPEDRGGDDEETEETETDG